MFTKQHYVVLAQALKESRPPLYESAARRQWHLTASEIMGRLAVDNPNFDKDRFRSAIFDRS